MYSNKGMYIDVIGKPALKDRKIPGFLNALTKLHNRHSKYEWALIPNVDKVYEMVEKILKKLNKGRIYSKWGPVQPKIERLRIFGHGDPNMVQLGFFVRTGQTVEDLTSRRKRLKIQDVDLERVIMLINPG